MPGRTTRPGDWRAARSRRSRAVRRDVQRLRAAHRPRGRRGRRRDLRRPPAAARRHRPARRRARAGSTTDQAAAAGLGGRRRPASRPTWPRWPTRTCRPAPPTSALWATRCCASCSASPPSHRGGRGRARRRRPDPGRGRRARPGARRAPSCSPRAARPRTARSWLGPGGSPRSSPRGAASSTIADGHGGRRRRRDRRGRRRPRRARAGRASAHGPPTSTTRGRARSPGPSAAAVTRDGVDVLVGANLGSLEDAQLALASGADLAGLVRTEFLFLGRAQAPDVDEQEKAYRGLAEALGGRRADPAHPRRRRRQAARLRRRCRRRPTRSSGSAGSGSRWPARPCWPSSSLAIVRTAHATPVSLMFPMVSTVDELVEARRMLDAAVAAEGRGEPAGLAGRDHGRGARRRR